MPTALSSTHCPPPAILERLLKQFLVLSLYLVAASIFTHLYLDISAHYLGKETEQLVSGEPLRPFAYRVLTPALIQASLDALPDTVKARLSHDKTGQPRTLKAAARYDWSGNDQAIFVVSYLLLWLCSLLTLLLWRSLLQQQQIGGLATRILAPVLGLLALPLFFAKSGYIYDLPELLLFSAALLCFLRQRWSAYYLLFAIAVLNKETALLMGLFFTPLLLRGDYRALARHAALHAAIGLPLLAAIRVIMADLPGTALEWHFENNLKFFASTEPWFKFDDIYAQQLPTPRALNPLNLLLLLGPILLKRKQLNRDLALSALAMLLVLLPTFVLLGNEDEIRVFIPVLPLGFLLYSQAMLLLFTHRETT